PLEFSRMITIRRFSALSIGLGLLAPSRTLARTTTSGISQSDQYTSQARFSPITILTRTMPWSSIARYREPHGVVRPQVSGLPVVAIPAIHSTRLYSKLKTSPSRPFATEKRAINPTRRRRAGARSVIAVHLTDADAIGR